MYECVDPFAHFQYNGTLWYGNENVLFLTTSEQGESKSTYLFGILNNYASEDYVRSHVIQIV